VLGVGFEAMTSPTAKSNGTYCSCSRKLRRFCYHCLDNSDSKIGFRSIHVVGEATALFLRSTPTTGSFIFREDQQRVKNHLLCAVLSRLTIFVFKI